MAYSTPKMVRQAIVPSLDGGLPDPVSNTAADLSDAQLLDAIAEADSLIDSYIGAFYAVPVAAVGTPSVVPHPIDFWSRDLARFNAELVYRGNLDLSSTHPAELRRQHVMGALQMVAQGRMKLQIPDNVTGNAGTGAGQVKNPYDGDLWTPDDFSLGTAPNPGVNGQQFWWNLW